MPGAGDRQTLGGPGAIGLPTEVTKEPDATKLRDIFAELGLERCASCGSLVIEGSCGQCPTGMSAPAISVSIMGRPTGTVCASCSKPVVTGASYCGHCGEAVHASTLSLARVREMRARLETLR